MKKDKNIRIDDTTYQIFVYIKKETGKPIKRILKDLANRTNKELFNMGYKNK